MQNAGKSLRGLPLPAEAEFYSQYRWCLNSAPTLREVAGHLKQELRKLDWILEDWQRSEVVTNIFLLSYAIADTIDDYLAGHSYEFSKVGKILPVAGPAAWAAQIILYGAGKLRIALLYRLRIWKEKWRSAADEFSKISLIAEGFGKASILLEYRDRLAALLPPKFPKSLWRRRIKVPAFFHARDFTPSDCFELGRKLMAAFPDRQQPLMVVGLRTAGSYIAPLLVAYLSARVLEVDWVAVRPKKGLTAWEKKALRGAVNRKARVIIVDESIHSGETLVRIVGLLREAGIADRDMVVLNPAEPAFPEWKDSRLFRMLSRISVITLEPSERHKQKLLDSNAIIARLGEYFASLGYFQVQVVEGAITGELNRRWRAETPERVDVRLKRVYEVHLSSSEGRRELRYVLAKSVGWGWLSYHAFLAGQRLGKFVPPLLGLRDGILYCEWVPAAKDSSPVPQDRGALIGTVAAYISARASGLRLADDPTPDLGREKQHKGIELLVSALGHSYDSRIASALNRTWIRRRLLSESCPAPVLTDSKMSPEEWITSKSGLMKADFEHHGQGKNELGMMDPAYDLAGAIFHFGLSEDESAQLVNSYAQNSGDASIKDRIFVHKLLAGLWAQNLATLGLQNSRLIDRRDEFHRSHVASWNFLVSETVRECGRRCQAPPAVAWQLPLVSLDIDGVLDRMAFGFPSTTAAGIQAISLLHAHGYTIAVNTARSLREVMEYCRAYHFAGGVVEYGSAIYDALGDRHQALVSRQSLLELEQARDALRKIPGVFLNDDYQFSVRAFTYYQGRTSPLPSLMVQDLLAGLNLNSLRAHHTGLDTAIVAKDVDKGGGLLSLLSYVGLSPVDLVAVGDSEPDLAMFAVASRCFAPGNVSCAREAQLLGCHISDASYQPGLLQIARRVVHPLGGECDRCKAVTKRPRKAKGLFSELLDAADEGPFRSMLRRLLDGSLLGAIRQ
ncbi:MAG TPA: HAD hydrolase family protein [Candidatus Saccharimonadales bacterium]|nr:HAD hydrolase family protein [Candidatus Saccharimonadales bacterium]